MEIADIRDDLLNVDLSEVLCRVLEPVENQKDKDSVVSAGEMGVMADIASEASILVLARLQPRDQLFCFLRGELMFESCESSERPVAACYFEMFSEIFPNGV